MHTARLAEQVQKLEAALEKVANLDYPRTRKTPWFPDGRISKHDKCPHGTWFYEDCGNCIAEFARAFLTPATGD